jgi:hypothetical protein
MKADGEGVIPAVAEADTKLMMAYAADDLTVDQSILVYERMGADADFRAWAETLIAMLVSADVSEELRYLLPKSSRQELWLNEFVRVAAVHSELARRHRAGDTRWRHAWDTCDRLMRMLERVEESEPGEEGSGGEENEPPRARRFGRGRGGVRARGAR